jgi:hypothetical protein
MNQLCPVILAVLAVPFFCAAEPTVPKGYRVPYSIDRSIFTVRRSSPAETDPGSFAGRRTPGGGCALREWKVAKMADHVYRISGTVVDDNAGLPVPDAAILVGNISICPQLRLLATADEDGAFRIEIDNRTWEQLKADAQAHGFVAWRDEDDPPLPQDIIYSMHRYLYVGQSYYDLYRYEIPYEMAEQEHGQDKAHKEDTR